MPEITVNGFNIDYYESGRGEPLIFINGLGGYAGAWAADLKFYDKYFRCICPDNRYMKGKNLPVKPFTIKDMAGDVSALMDALGIEKACVLSLSMGGAVAQELALSHPGKVKKLILSSSFPKTDAHFRLLLKTLSAMLPECSLRTFCNMFALWTLRSGFLKKYPEELIAMQEFQIANPYPEGIFKAQSDACIKHDTTSRLGEISCPALVTAGEEDIMTPLYYARELERLIPDSRLETFAGCGHLHLWENPDEYHKVTLDFLLGD
ncbi:MAG: alpha/beta hydrolase [Chloroflexi bacterium]|nr:alpha/beta hydrolase [Chloroflexota bacterium]